MKTNVKFALRTSHSTPERGILQLSITRHRSTSTISTSYSLSFKEWNDKLQMVNFLKSSPSTRKKELVAIWNKLKNDRQLILKIVDTLESKGDYTSQDVVRYFREQQQGRLFCEYVNQVVERRNKNEKFGTAHIYRFAALSFLKFLGGKDIGIEKINKGLIKDYERYLLAEKKSKNTVSCYMRSLRAVYNQAIAEKVFIAETKDKAFSDVFTGNAKTEKRAIDANAISRLAEVKTDEIKEEKRSKITKITKLNSLYFIRDLFMFSFYTQGMSFADMVNLKKENIKDGFIRYNRKKTGQRITIQMETCMKEIINRYLDPNSDYIFPVLSKYENCSEQVKWEKTNSALAAYNKKLKGLAVFVGIDGHLTSYVARHSWASLASQEGVPIATISRGLGHESEKTTRIYVSQLDSSDVGRANRQVISRISALKSPETEFKINSLL